MGKDGGRVSRSRSTTTTKTTTSRLGKRANALKAEYLRTRKIRHEDSVARKKRAKGYVEGVKKRFGGK